MYWEDQTAIDCRSAAGSPSYSSRGAHPRSKKVLWYFARLPISSQIFSQAALYLVFYFPISYSGTPSRETHKKDTDIFRDKIFPQKSQFKRKVITQPQVKWIKGWNKLRKCHQPSDRGTKVLDIWKVKARVVQISTRAANADRWVPVGCPLPLNLDWGSKSHRHLDIPTPPDTLEPGLCVLPQPW